MEWKADKALVFGATGLIGRSLTRLLVAEGPYREIVLFTRKPLESTTPKVKVVSFDFNRWEGVEQHFTPNAHVFCCIGTTRNKTPDLEEYRRIDLGIPSRIAEYAARGSCRGLYVISALGANENSLNFYQKIKGEMEKAVLHKGLYETYFFRPSLLLGDRDEKRKGEDFAKTLNAIVGPVLLGPLKKFRGVPADVVARAMIRVAGKGFASNVIENHQIFALGDA